MAEKLAVRDFIYLDVDRLKSILSQLEEGLLEKVDKMSGSSGSGQGSLEVGIPLLAKFGGVGSYVASSEVTETRTLHDHIYNYVESKLLEAQALFILSEELTAEEWLDDQVRAGVSDTAFVLITGRALINDFGYMKGFMGGFNDIAAAATRLASSEELKDLPENRRDARLKQLVAASQFPKQQIKDLRLVLDMFVRSDTVVRILPFHDSVDARAVANLDNPAALRIPLESLSFRFGSAPRGDWTLFGQIASVPKSTDEPFQFAGVLGAELEKAMQQLFNVLRGFEPLIGSVVYPEICVVPIALYRG